MKELIIYVAIIVVSMIFSAIQKKNKERKKQQYDAFPWEDEQHNESEQQKDNGPYTTEDINDLYPEKPVMTASDSGLEDYLLPDTRIETSYFSYDDHLDSDYSAPVSSLEESSITSLLNPIVSPLQETADEDVKLDFDLHQAVIYSEILTPKYRD